jgi:predicted permease
VKVLGWLREDVWISVRLLWRSRGFVLPALLSMAIAVGMNSTVFSLIRGVLLTPLPYDQPDRLFSVFSVGHLGLGGVSVPDFQDIEKNTTSFETLAISRTQPFTITGGTPEAVWGGGVSASLFKVLNVRPMLGRTFTADEETPGRHRVVLISEGLWRRRFNANPNIVGTPITLNREPYEIIGVMAEATAPFDAKFRPPSQLWVPIQYASYEPKERIGRVFLVVGRLRPGATPERAQVELEVLAGQLQQAYPKSNKDVRLTLEPMSGLLVRWVRIMYLLLLGAVALILLIGCANVANLGLARSIARTKDSAIRAALGATPARLVRFWLTESLVLCLASGIAGLAIAAIGIRLFTQVLGPRLPSFTPIGIDVSVLAFTFAIATLAAVVVGLVPAIHMWRLDPNEPLKESGGRGSTGGAGRRAAQYALIVSEVAVVCVLWIGAALMISSVSRLYRVDPGFDPSNLLAVELSLPPSTYRDAPQIIAFWRTLSERLRAVGGVTGVSVATMPPFAGRDTDRYFVIEGKPTPAPGSVPNASFRVAGSGYFSVMKIPILAGRDFDERDVAGRPRAVIINKAMKDKYWPNEDPIGQRFRRGMPGTTMPLLEIVGVAGNVRHRGLDDNPRPEFYASALQDERHDMFVMLRAQGDPRALVPVIREEVSRLDPNQPIGGIQTVEQLIDETAGTRRLLARLLTLFAGLALILSVVGVYSVVSNLASSRMREFGIRLVHGAAPSHIFRLVLTRGMTLIGIGLIIGIGASLAFGRVLESYLFGIAATDVWTYAAVVLLLGGVGLVANAVPARRATRVDPVANLRSE